MHVIQDIEALFRRLDVIIKDSTHTHEAHAKIIEAITDQAIEMQEKDFSGKVEIDLADKGQAFARISVTDEAELKIEHIPTDEVLTDSSVDINTTEVFETPASEEMIASKEEKTNETDTGK